MSELKAGRELDALVAEKVMGRVWAVAPMTAPIKVLIEPQFKTGDWQELKGGEIASFGNLPLYSTDIAAAWEVVEKLRGDRITVGVTAYDRDVECEIHIGGLHTVRAETAPLAICRAALKAVDA